MAREKPRDRPFSANEWRLFGMWLNYLDKGLTVAYDLAQRGDQATGELGVSVAVTGTRWYTTDLALLDAVVYRAAGRRKDEKICFDQELSDVVVDKLEEHHPQLRALRNALFSHPPFVDELVGPDEVVLFTTHGVHITTFPTGFVRTIVDPFEAHMELPATIERLRAIFVDRQDAAQRTKDEAEPPTS